MLKNKFETLGHLTFWIFILAAINVDWTANWFDSSIRPNTPAPLSVIMFALFFYLNTFLLLPRYFSSKTWPTYTLLAFLLFIVPELIRMTIAVSTGYSGSITGALASRESLIFGTPSPFFLAISVSFVYRLTRDALLPRKQADIDSPDQSNIPYEDTTLLTDSEAEGLHRQLKHLLEKEEVFLDPDLTLRSVALAVDSTEKKVSYLINQHLNTGFNDFINAYRVNRFKTEVTDPANDHLSMVGIALNCGFPSKSSFYRTFKAHVDMSPSEYLKSLEAQPRQLQSPSRT